MNFTTLVLALMSFGNIDQWEAERIGKAWCENQFMRVDRVDVIYDLCGEVWEESFSY